jgi:hypothetical protein
MNTQEQLRQAMQELQTALVYNIQLRWTGNETQHEAGRAGLEEAQRWLRSFPQFSLVTGIR